MFRYGRKAHIWIFFDSPIPAVLARRLGLALLEKGRMRESVVNFSLILNDTKKMEEFKRFIASHEHAKQYKK